MDYTSANRMNGLQRFAVSDHHSAAMIKTLQAWNGERDQTQAKIDALAAGREQALADITAIDPAELAQRFREYEQEQLLICQDLLRTWAEHPNMANEVQADLNSQLQKARERAGAAAAKVKDKLQPSGIADHHISAIAADDPDVSQAHGDITQIEGLIKGGLKVPYKGRAGDFHNRPPIEDVERMLRQSAELITGVQIKEPLVTIE